MTPPSTSLGLPRARGRVAGTGTVNQSVGDPYVEALVNFTGGLFEELAGGPEVMTNSLHGQAIERLAEGLEVEARAADGTIEEIRLPGAKAFTAAGQWHMEWHPENHTLSRGLYTAFDAAIHERAKG